MLISGHVACGQRNRVGVRGQATRAGNEGSACVVPECAAFLEDTSHVGRLFMTLCFIVRVACSVLCLWLVCGHGWGVGVAAVRAAPRLQVCGGLAQVRIFGNLIEDLPARAARENLRKFACPESGPGHEHLILSVKLTAGPSSRQNG